MNRLYYKEEKKNITLNRIYYFFPGHQVNSTDLWQYQQSLCFPIFIGNILLRVPCFGSLILLFSFLIYGD